MHDIPGIAACNFLCFPEEDPRDSYHYGDCLVFWPRLFYVVIAKTGGERHGYISYLGVRPTHLKQGIAKKLMTAAENAMVREYGSQHFSLYVRKSSLAAVNLFAEKLGYKIQETAPEFYDNGEDANVMEKKTSTETSRSSWEWIYSDAELQGLLERLQLC
ncbi:hypothetical protein MKX01_034383 [Papaver californicum]|nr:hypothetical protein MKX01_034383 [Papaver californicum]